MPKGSSAERKDRIAAGSDVSRFAIISQKSAELIDCGPFWATAGIGWTVTAPSSIRTIPRSIITVLASVLGTARIRSEEHTSELQSLMRNTDAVFCLKKK